jgi:hypothetical protein
VESIFWLLQALAHLLWFGPQTMDIVDMAIQQAVCLKSDIHGNSDLLNSQKLDPIQITAKKFRPKHASLSMIFCCEKLTHGSLQK